MKNILAFCFFPAFVPPSNGGQARLFNFYMELSRRFRITLLTSTHPGGREEVVQHGPFFTERRIPKDAFFMREWSLLSEHSSGGDLSAPCIAACGHYPTKLHLAYLEEYQKADMIMHDFPFTRDYDLFFGLDNKIRVYNAHNCETDLYQTLHSDKKSKKIHEIVRDCEKRMLCGADFVFYCSDADLASFRSLVPDAGFKAVFTPHGMSVPKAVQECCFEKQKVFTAVFMGSSHPPNTQAALFIVNKLAPKLDNVSFDIIGGCLPEGNYPPNVFRHGQVCEEKKEEILARAHIALNPMQAGSGANVKVMDYWAYKLPVLSTEFGIRGIEAVEGKEYFKASLSGFAEIIKVVAARPEILSSIGQAGHDLAVRRYTWKVIAENASQVLANALQTGEKNRRYVLAINDYDSFKDCGGGGTRTRGLYEAVSVWSPVIFLCFSNDEHLRVRSVNQNITVISIPKTIEHHSEICIAENEFYVSINDVIASIHCTRNPLILNIYSSLRELARCVVVEHCYMTPVPLTFDDRFIYSSHNNEFELKSSTLKWHPRRKELLERVADLEEKAVEHSAATVCVSDDEARGFVLNRRTLGSVVVVRNGAAVPSDGPLVPRAVQKIKGKIRSKSVVFIGSAHSPNVDAADYIIKKIAPRLKNVQFHFIGSVCSSFQNVTSGTNVVLWGILDDVEKTAVMSLCAIALNPMRSGGGSNVKLADYIGHGLFVLTTDIGVRGYPASVFEHLKVAELEIFTNEIESIFKNFKLFSKEARLARRRLFESDLSMRGLGGRFVDLLKNQEVARKRVLYVAYRYTYPAHGGAEINIEKFIEALGKSGQFDVDVVAPCISSIQNCARFTEKYSFDENAGVPVGIPNVRFARFPVQEPDPLILNHQVRDAWSKQPEFEKELCFQLCRFFADSGLTWGWGYPEKYDNAKTVRWAMIDCGLFLHADGLIQIDGHAPQNAVIIAMNGAGGQIGEWTVCGNFSIRFSASAGHVSIKTSGGPVESDLRPLGFMLRNIFINKLCVDLDCETLMGRYACQLPADSLFECLDQAASNSRKSPAIHLANMRGPWSPEMETYISEHVREYDLVVTHNHIFRPASVAVREAAKQGVPSVLIPHIHLDDDFYHFPDILETARLADAVLLVPKIACQFFEKRGCRVRYMPAGCDTKEDFSAEDVHLFRSIYTRERPFILVLGRKAKAKGYHTIVSAVDELNRTGTELDVVLIGPDDDGEPIHSRNAFYLGRQPRSVVRGALMSCTALCNMSSSESFGIVLLEAWLAGKPVVINKNCAAFHDMAKDEVNSLMAQEKDLSKVLLKILHDPELRTKLAENGKKVCSDFDWEKVCHGFVEVCLDTSKKSP